MRKRRLRRSVVEPTAINLEEVKTKIKELIIAQFGTVKNFAESEEAKTMDLSSSAIRTVITPSGGKSLPLLNKLCQFFDLPLLESRTKVTYHTEYFYKD